MATIGADNPTLTDVAKRLDPDGKIDAIAELLKERNEILDDMTSVEGNLPTGHRYTVRTGLPQAYWRLLNQGTPDSKSTTAQITDTVGELVARGTVDTELAKLNGNTSDFRLSENRAFIESMNQTVAETLIYGNDATKPESFLGLAPRFSDGRPDEAENAEMLINAGGVGNDDNTSIWLVVWSPESVFSIFPKGSQAGLSHRDLGEDYVDDGDGNKFLALRDHYMWKIGLCVKDWRFVSRIANINESNLSVDPASTADGNLIVQMTRAVERIRDLNAGRPVFYCSRKIREWLRLQSIHQKNVRLSYEEMAGRRVVMFDGIPVRRVDQIVHTEAAVPFGDS